MGVHIDATSERKRPGATCRSIFVSELAQPGRCANARAKLTAARPRVTALSSRRRTPQPARARSTSATSATAASTTMEISAAIRKRVIP